MDEKDDVKIYTPSASDKKTEPSDEDKSVRIYPDVW